MENIGSKIKVFSMVILVLGVLGSLLAILNVPASGNALIFAFIGILSSVWLSLFIYGFGELIDKTTEIAENTKTLVLLKKMENNEKD